LGVVVEVGVAALNEGAGASGRVGAAVDVGVIAARCDDDVAARCDGYIPAI